MKEILYQISRFIPDKIFLKLKFRKNFGRFPNLDSPVSFNEKITWLKLYLKHSKYTDLVDKYRVKAIVGEKIGLEHIIPTLGVWKRAEDIDFQLLPNQFVLKTTHGSGDVIICKDKSQLDIIKIQSDLNKALRTDLYLKTREWPYKNVTRQIIAEQFMVDESGTELKDYKFFCFGGHPKFFKIDFGRFQEHHANYYDLDGRLLPFGEADFMPIPERKFTLPSNFTDMVAIASTLSTNLPFVRIDLYNVNGQIFFGEITFFPASGVGKIEPESWDYKIGELLQLPL